MLSVMESINIVINESLNVTEKEYELFQVGENGNWYHIRFLSYDEMMDLCDFWDSMEGYIDNDFGIVDQTIAFSHYLLPDKYFIANRL